MIICSACRREMIPDRNGVGIDFGGGHVYPADRFKCPSCKKMILNAPGNSVLDSSYVRFSEYYDMHKRMKKAGDMERGEPCIVDGEPYICDGPFMDTSYVVLEPLQIGSPKKIIESTYMVEEA